MDKQTHRFYADNSAELFERYSSSSGGLEKYFAQAYPQPGCILDVGAGSGRDVSILLRAGHDAYGLEPCDEFRELAEKKYPELKSRMLKGRIPDELELVRSTVPDKFDGIVSSAMLMHIPPEFLLNSIAALKMLLKPQGRILFSIPLDRPDIDADNREPKGRYFNQITGAELESICGCLAFKPLQEWHDKDSLKRPGITWASLLFELSFI